jgi:hypothetical protein
MAHTMPGTLRRRLAATGAVLATSFALSVAHAGAAEPGVTVDHGSPASKEYAIPLDAARSAGQGGTAATATGPPLFGAGISPARAAAKERAGSGHRRHRRAAAAPAAAAPTADLRGRVNTAGVGPSGSSGMLWTVLIALGVLGSGAAAGLALRRARG